MPANPDILTAAEVFLAAASCTFLETPELAALRAAVDTAKVAGDDGARLRIELLEDTITDAGIILAGADPEAGGEYYTVIRKAMQCLGKVMSDPAVLKRQGI